jgi:dTDP-glucose pyrophosphorylase
MIERPILNRHLSSSSFREFYYLKDELVAFCKAEGLSTRGDKIELTDRIVDYLDTGEKKTVHQQVRKRSVDIKIITRDSKIESDFICSEKHRSFFRENIGSSFTFNVPFQKWLKANTGKTYEQAIEAYFMLIKEKQKGKIIIDRQFEYNTYIRDFFSNNKGRSLDDAIKCWKYKKGLEGHNRYEQSDLIALPR